MADVFVSYKAEDRRRVKPLVQALEAEGFSVWWDEQIGGGEAWRRAIETELDAAKSVLVVWSKRSAGAEGTFVQDEAARAQQRKVYVPILIDPVHLPLGFGETQAISLMGWKANRADPRYQAVLAAVRRVTGAETGLARSRPARPFPVNRRLVLIGGTAAAAAGVGAWALLRPDGGAASNGIAVLPFANLSGDPAQAYFSDGIAEELRSALGRVAGLEVVGRISSEAVADADAKTASRKLGVPNVLTGSVRRSPSTVRVSAQLIDGRTGIEKWSQNYDRAPGDTIKIQTEIAMSVAQALSIALGGGGRAVLAAGQTANAAAQNLILQAREVGRKGRNRSAAERALALVDQAIALDPGYANAYAHKSMMLNGFANAYATPAELPLLRALALEFANKAIALAPGSAAGHAALAICRMNALNIAGADAAFRQAMRLAPGQVDILGTYVGVLSAMSPREGVALADRALAGDPLNPGLQTARLAAIYGARRYAEVVQLGLALERRAPELFRPNDSVAYSLILLGKLGEARTYLRRRFTTEDWQRVIGEILIDIRSGNRAAVPQAVESAKQLYGALASYQYGQIFTQLGDKDRAFAALDDAWKIKDLGLLSLRSDAMLDPLRSHPRYAAIERKLNFPR